MTEAVKLYDVIGMEGGKPSHLDELDVNYGAAALRERGTDNIRNGGSDFERNLPPGEWGEVVAEGSVFTFTPAGPVERSKLLFVIMLRRETDVESIFLKHMATELSELMWCDGEWRYVAMHWNSLVPCMRATAIELMVNIPKEYKDLEAKKRQRSTILILEHRLSQTLDIYYDRKLRNS